MASKKCASSLGSSLVKCAAQLEKILARDPGNRGIGNLCVDGDLYNAAQTLHRAKNVGVVTGFYIPACSAPETDGPLGALSIARALEAQGSKATIITDKLCAPFMEDFLKEIGESRFRVLALHEQPSRAQLDQYLFGKKEREEDQVGFDALVAIERVGPAKDGRYYNMRASDITEYAGRGVSDLWLAAETEKDRYQVALIGIGDGGNEVGMGRANLDQIKKDVNKGEKIACTLSCDHLIVTGVSNWAGYALGGVLYLLSDQKKSSTLTDYLPSVDIERNHLQALVKTGCVDGPTQTSCMMVDALDFEADHATMLRDIQKIVQDQVATLDTKST